MMFTMYAPSSEEPNLYCEEPPEDKSLFCQKAQLTNVFPFKSV